MEYKQPSELAVCQDPVIQEVIGAEDLETHLRLSYLHPHLQAQLPPSLLATLGVRRLRGADVAAVTCAMARELVQNAAPLSGTDRRGQWAFGVFSDQVLGMLNSYHF